MVVADASLSTRCGVDGVPIAAAIARAIATIGMSAVFFQDPFGLITFDAGFEHLGGVRPRIGKSQVIHCLDAYQFGTRAAAAQARRQPQHVARRLHAEDVARAGHLRLPVRRRRTTVMRELAQLNAAHDVFLVLIDSAFAFELPSVSAGWIEAFDVETGTLEA